MEGDLWANGAEMQVALEAHASLPLRQRQFKGPSADEERVLKSLWDRYAMPHQVHHAF